MTSYEIYCSLKEKRKVKDSDVAKATNIGKSTFSDWKSGRSVPKQDKMQKIADYFCVSLDYMMGKTENHVIATVEPAKRDRVLALATSEIGMSPARRSSENAFISGGPTIKTVKSGLGLRGVRIEVKQTELSKRTQDIAKIIESLDESDQEIVLSLARRLKENHQ